MHVSVCVCVWGQEMRKGYLCDGVCLLREETVFNHCVFLISAPVRETRRDGGKVGMTIEQGSDEKIMLY